MQAKKCDRCGSYYIDRDKYSPRFLLSSSNVFFGRRDFDLCKTCLRSLGEWLHEYNAPDIDGNDDRNENENENEKEN